MNTATAPYSALVDRLLVETSPSHIKAVEIMDRVMNEQQPGLRTWTRGGFMALMDTPDNRRITFADEADHYRVTCADIDNNKTAREFKATAEGEDELRGALLYLASII